MATIPFTQLLRVPASIALPRLPPSRKPAEGKKKPDLDWYDEMRGKRLAGWAMNNAWRRGFR